MEARVRRVRIKKNFKSQAELFSMEWIFQNVLCYHLARKNQSNYNFGNKNHKHFADKSNKNEKGIGPSVYRRSMSGMNIHMLKLSWPQI